MWSEKYRPESLERMVGNKEARARLVIWLGKWKKGSKAALLVGPPGVGKTTTVQLTARKLGMNLVQLNASDRRTKDMLSERLGEALFSANLFGEKSLIFMDEIDGLAGRSDYGAIEFLKDAVKKSQNPIVMAANDPESDEVRKLGSVTTSLVFVRPSPEEMKAYLREIAKREGVQVDASELSGIVERANGDVRAAINALQAGLPAAKDEELTTAASVKNFFDAADQQQAMKALRLYPRQPRDKVRDIFTSVSHTKIHPERRAMALDVLSRADVLIGRMMRGGDWRLLRYLDPLLASELRESLGDGGVNYTAESVPWLLQLRIWNDARKLRDIGGLLGRRLGISQRGSMVEDVPYVLVMCGKRSFREEFVASLGLEENYEAFLAKESVRPHR